MPRREAKHKSCTDIQGAKRNPATEACLNYRDLSLGNKECKEVQGPQRIETAKEDEILEQVKDLKDLMISSVNNLKCEMAKNSYKVLNLILKLGCPKLRSKS